MKKVAFFTTARAEFGILSALIREIEKDAALQYLLFVGGMHLAEEYGCTVKEIEEQKFEISGVFDFLLNEDNPFSLAKSVGIATQKAAKIFKEFDFDFVCVLGDRFELLSIVANAILFKKPIIHIHGGEITKGAIDEQIRHMITKAAHLHFVSCNEYAENIRRMAEQDRRIFNTGALVVDNIKRIRKIPKTNLFKELKLNANLPTVLMTYHPVTLELSVSPLEQIDNVFKALKAFNFQVVITAPNIEMGRKDIVNRIKTEVHNKAHYHYFDSLGMERYLNLIPHCIFLIGNSSSGILEVPFFKIPTINIGERQLGRVRHKSIIDTDYSTESIIKSINKALSEGFTNSLKNMAFKFGNGNTARKMVKIIKSVKIDQAFLRKNSDLLEG